MRLAFPLVAFALVVGAAYAPGPPVSVPGPLAADTTWSWPEDPENLQVLPETMGGEQLGQVMRGFTRALGVRCQFCHVGEEGADFQTWDFASDAKPHKEVARGMMRMTRRINVELLPAVDGLAPAGDDWRVTCYTCHRGAPHPATSRDREAAGEGHDHEPAHDHDGNGDDHQ